MPGRDWPPLHPPIIGTGFVVGADGILATNWHVWRTILDLPRDPHPDAPKFMAYVMFHHMREDGAMVTFDGQVGFTLRPDDVIEIKAAEHKITLIRAPEKNFYAILREKLKWGEA